MLRITAKEQDSKLTLALEGKLTGPWVAELAKAWSEWQGKVRPGDTLIDLRMVSFVDEAGRVLLTELHRAGCALAGSGAYVGPLVAAIIQGRETGAAPLRWCWMTALGLAIGSLVAAAAAEPPALPLSLSQALHTALAQNPDLQRSLLAVAQSQEDTRTAAAALRPAFDASAQVQRLRMNLDTELGKPTPGGPDIAGPYNWGLVQVEGSMPLFDLSLWSRWKASQHGERSAKAGAEVTREGIIALVVAQYLAAQRATESVKAAQSRVELAQALDKLAQDQQKNGLGTSLDTLRAQVQERNEQQRLIQANTQLRTARFGLAKLLDLDPATPIEITDSLEAPAAAEFNFQDAYRTGLAQRPELASLDAQEQAQRELKDAARNLRLPSVQASASYGSAALLDHAWVPTYTLTLGVKVPLFTGGRITAQTARADQELQRIRESQDGVRTQVGVEIQTAQANLESSRSEVDVADQAVQLAQEALVQARHRFEAGVSNNIEVIQAQDELARASDNQISALYRLNQSRADLARAMGQLEPLYVR
jgi:outer membrane protein TolC/ABC-type transporter Mla MlaB component